MTRLMLALLALGAVAAPAAAQDNLACPYRAGMAPATRTSPLDSVSFQVGGHTVKVCYGRPSLKGRTMIGGEAVPYGKVWRTGANETTKLIATTPLSVGGIEIPAGMYALYTVPGATEWEVIVNRSYQQWGRENTYTDSVKAQEVGRARAKVETLTTPIEQFTIRAEPQPDGSAQLVLEWQTSRIRVPVVRGKM
jgi:hypothetical protein